jgi:putative aldouronate transport system substrate-binding protein
MKSLNDTPFAQYLIEQTGVEVEFIHPAQGQELEQFNLLLASGKMPDIVEYSWLTQYLGGPDAAIRNNMMFPLNDVLETWAPDYLKVLEENPVLMKMAKTDEGNFYGFPLIQLDAALLTTAGTIIRKDWLDDLGLAVPETLDDWENVLTRFKNEKGATVPLAGDAKGLGFFYFNAIIGAYGIQTSFYVENAKIKFGPLEPSFKTWLVRMKDWYAKGLIDPDFAINVRKEKEANVLNGKTGIFFGYAQSTMGAMSAAIKDIDPKADFIGIKYPVLNKGERPKMGQKNFQLSYANPVAVVNPKSEHVETAVKLLNYGYSDEGYILFNFGVEGKTFNFVNGFPQMVDSILKPEKGSVAQTWSVHARSPYNGPFVQSGDFLTQYMDRQSLREAIVIWGDTDAAQYNLPPLFISTDDSKEYNQIRSNLNSFVEEWVIKAITGQGNIDEFESVFIKTINEIGVDKAVQILQAAYDRFQAR